MKLFVFVLVLANLLLYALGAGYLGRTGNPDAVRMSQQVAPERMRIVGRGEAPSASEVAAVPAPAETAICLAWAGLTVSDADRLAALLGEQFPAFKVRRQSSGGEGKGWWVFMPPQPNKAAAERKAQQLRGLGVTDYFIVPEGSSQFAISLGIFSSEKGARDRLSELQGRGVRTAQLSQRPDKESTVRIEASGPPAGEADLRAAVLSLSPSWGGQACQ